MATTDQKEIAKEATPPVVESASKKAPKKSSKKPLEALEDMLGIPHGDKAETDGKKTKKEGKKDNGSSKDLKDVLVNEERSTKYNFVYFQI